jgi:hypothetical protein
MSLRFVPINGEYRKVEVYIMKRVLIVLVMVLSVSTFVAAVPYPYAAYELETQGNLKSILDEVVVKYTVIARSEKGSILPWSKAWAAIYSMEIVEAAGNYYAHQNFMTEKERESLIQSYRSQMVDTRLCFGLILVADKEEYVAIDSKNSKISTIVLETDKGSIYQPSELREDSKEFDFNELAWKSYYTVCFPRFNNKKQIIDEDTEWVKLWVVAGSERIFMQFNFQH